MNMKNNDVSEVWLSEFDFGKLRQSLEYKLCRRVDLDIFSDFYHNGSYIIPTKVLHSEWDTINLLANMLLHDYKEVWLNRTLEIFKNGSPSLNMKIECKDNLEFMKSIEDSSIDVIYSDILYGTGRKFSDYQDLKPIKSDIEQHYLPRIKEMHRILKDSGTIYLQMDTKINHWLRCIMDDIFGYDKMRNEIIWFYNTAPRKKLDFGKRHDVILRYTKSDIYKFNPPREPYSETAPRGYEKEKYYHPEGKVVGDVWQMNILGQNDKKERVGYDTQKPLSLVERIIKSSSDEGDLIADFYLGSGTTAVACKNLNRRFIGCDINQKAINLTLERLK